MFETSMKTEICVFTHEYQAASCKDILYRINNLKMSRKFCDVVITEGSSVIYAHSCVLAAGSVTFLDKLLDTGFHLWSISKPLELRLSQLIDGLVSDEIKCFNCFSRIIDYMYSGQISIDSSHTNHFWKLWHFLKIAYFKGENGSDEQNDVNVESKVEDSIVISEASSVENVSKKTETKNAGIEKDKTNCKTVHSGDINVLEKLKDKSESGLVFNREKFLEKSQNKRTDAECASISQNSKKPSGSDDDSEVPGNLCPNDLGEYYCAKCKLNLKNSQLYAYHKKVYHTKKFHCISCSFTSMKLSYMIFHLLNTQHTENICSICLYEASDVDGLKKHFLDHRQNNPYQCYICGSSFRSRTDLLRHNVTHNTGIEHFNCEICKLSFNSKTSLNSHMLSHEESLKCDKCGFNTLNKAELSMHLEKHEKELNKKYFCPVIPCTFSTSYKYNLRDHLKSHEVTKSYTCKQCALKFTLEKNLFRHMGTIHGKPTEYYECCRCPYKNARIDKAKTHCESVHPGDINALNHILEQHKKKKESGQVLSPKKCLEKSQNKETNTECTIESKNSKNTSGDVSYILSESTGEFHIISENSGEQVSVASVTSTNVLTIGNFREGTGSVTLNETTGIVTMNNINSDTTGAVFLNESTGELSYINLGNDKMDTDSKDSQIVSEVQTELNEVTGEIRTVCKNIENSDYSNDDELFDSFDMDIDGDSCDGFDDLDNFLFDPEFEKSDIFSQKIEERSHLIEIPHLNETTGELSFDQVNCQDLNQNLTAPSSEEIEETIEDSKDEMYPIVLNEVTGELIPNQNHQKVITSNCI